MTNSIKCFALFFTILLSTLQMEAQIPKQNLKFWFKGDSLVSKNSVNKVTGWASSINSADFLTNTDTSVSPTFANNFLHFDGINDYLQMAFPLTPQPLTYFILWKGEFSNYDQIIIDGKTAANRDAVIYGPNTNGGQIGIYATVTDLNYSKPSFNNFITSRFTFDGNNSSMCENNIPKSININVGSAGIDGLTIGSRFSFDYNFHGTIGEVLVYDAVLNINQIDSVEQYLNDKYAPPIELPNDITIINSVCDTIIKLVNPNNNQYSNYLWSNGATTPTISVNKSGKYWLNATNVFEKVSSDTIVVNFPDYHKPIQNYICTGNTLLWDTDLPKSDYSFIWQDNTTTDSVFTITQSGNYYATITDLFGCSITTETVIVTQDNFPTTTSLGPDRPICSGNTITLTSGLSSSNSYTWSTGSINDSLLITNTGQYSVIVTNTNNCIAKDTINITIQGQAPIANFTTSIGCVNSSVAFINSSLAPAGNTFTLTSWNFGDSNTSPLFNPSHTYTNTGTYTVSVLVQTDANCSQSISKIVNINPVPTASFVSGIACQNDSTTFFNQSTSQVGFPISSSYWNFGDLTTSNLTSPKHVFANPVIYTTKLLVTNNVGCKDSIYKTVNVQAEVKANFTNSPACTNTATHFQSTSIIPVSGSPTYAWNFGNSTANTTTPIKTYTNSGVYYVTLTVDGTNGCTSTITKLLNVYLPPIANFSISSFCAKDTVTILNLSSPQSGMLSSYNWKLNATNFSAIQSPTVSLNNAGNYSVRLTTINSFGCKDSTTNSLTVFPLPVVDFITNPTAYYYINEPVNFVPSITNASLYSWYINSIPTSTIQSPTETFNSEGAYTTSLNIKDQQGCKGSKTKNINVFKRGLDLAILNVTTAKDADGFISVVTDLANYGSVPINSFNVHYQTSDAGNIKENWTGTLLPNSFYVYTFNAKSASLQSNTNNITCVEIETVNSIVDDVTTNNSFCNTLNPDDISVSNPIPNPSSGDIKLPIITNKDIDYTIVIYNSTGQIQSEEITKKIVAGLHFISLPTSSYARGSYIIKITIDEKIFIKKFIKIDNQ